MSHDSLHTALENHPSAHHHSNQQDSFDTLGPFHYPKPENHVFIPAPGGGSSPARSWSSTVYSPHREPVTPDADSGPANTIFPRQLVVDQGTQTSERINIVFPNPMMLFGPAISSLGTNANKLPSLPDPPSPHAEPGVDDASERIRLLEQQLKSTQEANKVLKAMIRLQVTHTYDTSADSSSPLTQGRIDALTDRLQLIVEKNEEIRKNADLEKRNRELAEKYTKLEERTRQQNDILATVYQELGIDAATSGSSSPSPSLTKMQLIAFGRYWLKLRNSDSLLQKLSLTPRGVLLCMMLQRYVSRNRNKLVPSTLPWRNTLGLELNTGLDTPLGPNEAMQYCEKIQATRFFSSNADSTVLFRVCAVCKIPRFDKAPSPSHGHPYQSSKNIICEYPECMPVTPCCNVPICKTCFPAMIMERVVQDWWYNLNRLYWLSCPAKGSCTEKLRWTEAGELYTALETAGDPNAVKNAQCFDHANKLRNTLRELYPAPSVETCILAAKLHGRLERWGFMDHFFEQPGTPSVESISVDSLDGSRTVNIPIFTSLLKRSKIAIDCLVCSESIFDLYIADENEWETLCIDFGPDLSWRLRAFPSRTLRLACTGKHELNICRACLEHYIQTRLDDLGVGGCDRISCPSPNCTHVYEHDEIKALASPETFARYDRLRLLKTLSSEPNFRWCLGPDCESGEIYSDVLEEDEGSDDDGSPIMLQRWLRNHNSALITCSACGFQMCYRHQIPWHMGLTCAAYDSEQSEQSAQSRQYIDTRTKACPGPRCGAALEKNGGCFHMTCGVCSFQFCWECLASWDEIDTPQGYMRNGHREGCYFRDAGAQAPVHLFGNTIDIALGG